MLSEFDFQVRTSAHPFDRVSTIQTCYWNQIGDPAGSSSENPRPKVLNSKNLNGTTLTET